MKRRRSWRDITSSRSVPAPEAALEGTSLTSNNTYSSPLWYGGMTMPLLQTLRNWIRRKLSTYSRRRCHSKLGGDSKTEDVSAHNARLGQD